MQGLEKKGWLFVNRSKYLWFAVKNGKLLWFNQAQVFSSYLPPSPFPVIFFSITVPPRYTRPCHQHCAIHFQFLFHNSFY
jgi:hypothetical protein